MNAPDERKGILRQRMNTLALALLICTFLFAATFIGGRQVANAQQGGIEPTPSDLRQGIRQTREDVQQARANRCRRPRLWNNYPRVGDIPRDVLAGNLRWVQETLKWTRRGWDYCPVNLWWWYNNSGARCVREHEGSWRDPNPPYWGGFQFSWDFHGYGRKYFRRLGTADNWPRISQIHAAYNGWRARGFDPWPTTARMCGLL